MDVVGDWSGNLVSWSEFVLFHVLPIAVSQIYDWIREWQILVAVILVLLFLHLWTRTILRAARRAAKETVQTETRAFDASLKLLRQQLEAKPERVKKAAEAPRRPEPVQAPQPVEARAAVETLRQAIRLALGTIPMSDEPLSPSSERLYKAAIGALDDTGVEFPAELRQGVLGQLLSELGELRQAFPPQSCRQAWQSLVKVNALAREFHEPSSTRTQAVGTSARATP